MITSNVTPPEAPGQFAVDEHPLLAGQNAGFAIGRGGGHEHSFALVKGRGTSLAVPVGVSYSSSLRWAPASTLMNSPVM